MNAAKSCENDIAVWAEFALNDGCSLILPNRSQSWVYCRAPTEIELGLGLGLG